MLLIPQYCSSLNPKETLDDICQCVKSATGSDMFGDDTYKYALLILAIIRTDSINPKKIRSVAKVSYGTITHGLHALKSNGVICRYGKNRFRFADYTSDIGWMNLILDAMVAAGKLKRD